MGLRRNLRTFAWVIFLIGFVALPTARGQEKPAPDFWLRNLAGERFDSRKHQESFIVSFFFVGCVPCIKEIPELHQLVTSNHPKTALLYIDPLEDDSPETIAAFAKRLQVPPGFFYHDALGRIGKKYFSGNMYFPTIFVIRNGKIHLRIIELNAKAKEQLSAALK